MTAERDETESQANAGVPVEASGSSPVISRRALLRGATATVPTILTLQSGAALAATSSTEIGTNEYTGIQAEYGGTPCVNAASTEGMAGKSGKYKLGDPPVGEINIIPDGVEFRSLPDGAGEVMTPREMCYKYQHPGPYHYYDATTQTYLSADVPQGGLTSAGALVSFTGEPGVVIKNIINT